MIIVIISLINQKVASKVILPDAVFQQSAFILKRLATDSAVVLPHRFVH